MEKLTFKQYLIEAREDFIADKIGDKIMLAYKLDKKPGTPKNLTSASIIVKYIVANISFPKYINWVVNKYANRQFSLEDLNLVNQDLHAFDQLKRVLPNKDINAYTSWNAMRNVIQSANTMAGKKLHTINYENKVKEWVDKGEASIVYNQNGILIVHTLTHAANCALGSGTKWCTTAANPLTFNTYNARDPLYIIYLPNKHKYQLHGKTQQLKDEQDNSVLSQYSLLFNKYPQLLNILVELLGDRGDWLIDRAQFSQKLPQLRERLRQGTETQQDLTILANMLLDAYEDNSDSWNDGLYHSMITELTAMKLPDPSQALLKICKTGIDEHIGEVLFAMTLVQSKYNPSEYADVQNKINSIFKNEHY